MLTNSAVNSNRSFHTALFQISLSKIYSIVNKWNVDGQGRWTIDWIEFSWLRNGITVNLLVVLDQSLKKFFFLKSSHG